MKVKMLIIGAGVAGTMAYNYFRKLNPLVCEMKSNRVAFSDNDAVIRMKDPAIGYLFGSDVEEIEVEKWIFYKSKFYSNCNPFFSCSYSQKVTGRKGVVSRSIENLGKAKRYLMNPKMNIPNERIKFGQSLTGLFSDISGQYAVFNNDVNNKIYYDFIISTIPLPFMLGINGMEVDGIDGKEIFTKVPILIRNFPFRKNFAVEKYYTIYLPDPDIGLYRINLNQEGIKIESIYDELVPYIEDEKKCFKLIEDIFGIDARAFIDCLSPAKQMKENKIKNVDSNLRKRILYQLTYLRNVYSLGRYAIWKNIGVDDLMKDIRKIDQMISAKTDVLNYDMNGGKL